MEHGNNGSVDRLVDFDLGISSPVKLCNGLRRLVFCAFPASSEAELEIETLNHFPQTQNTITACSHLTDSWPLCFFDPITCFSSNDLLFTSLFALCSTSFKLPDSSTTAPRSNIAREL